MGIGEKHGHLVVVALLNHLYCLLLGSFIAKNLGSQLYYSTHGKKLQWQHLFGGILLKIHRGRKHYLRPLEWHLADSWPIPLAPPPVSIHH